MSEVQTREDDGVVEVRLNRPGKKNALTGAMYGAMADALAQAGASVSARVVLFSAEGDTFTAGNDIGDFLAMAGEFAETPPARFIRALVTFEKPMVAAVQGLAVGVGTTMLLHCDLVYAAPQARFSTPFVDMGLVPEAGSSALLPSRIGYQRAAALLLLGEAMGAEQALAAGLVNAVVAADVLQEHARERARAIAAKPPNALATARRLMRGDRASLEAHMRREQEAFGGAVRSAEARAAFTAFLERRPPKTARTTA
ncbi:MAG: enoyl-CoA hydratase/isomerase family protein [Acetobacteraceae bacterium]|nr:enoyl-CoA hydratase/isomerase family protein [Acetobacteraceae bacterium]